ncbi:efflux RND transporter periplasmic adaptor subunit, partial [Jatrophihabitans endophyticus]|uniref:efflux RND transporter periplasmic adaptor subunit n=1 Tax=Jatrophihabitans endophyticus TaxID=1206085 RepID=UPI001A02FA7D
SSNTSKLATGKVETLDNTIDTSTGTVRIRSTFANDDERLFPNQFVNARLLLKTLHDVALIPNNAIQTGPDGAFAYVVKPDSTVEVRPIKTGTADGTDTVVTTGLKAGEQVVTDGTDRLKAGAKVTIPGDQPANPGAGTPDAGTPSAHHHRRAASA